MASGYCLTVAMNILLRLNLPYIFFFIFQCVTETNAQSSVISESITVDNRNRTYLISLPSNHADASQALVIVLHGGGGSATQCERDYGWTNKSISEQFIVVYPDGIPSNKPLKLRTWNAGNCCHYASETNVDDVKFISILIDELVSRYQIDKKRIYVTGMSNGAMMAYRLACEIPEKITAIAAVAGTLMTAQPCNPSRAVPVLHIHSELDTKVPYAGGRGVFDYNFSSVDSTLSVWISVNHCQNQSPVITQNDQYTVYEWNTCDEVIQLYTAKDGGHSWPGGLKPRAKADNPSQAFNATELIWNFFKQYQLQ